MGENNFFIELTQNMQFEVTEAYIKSSTTWALIVGIIAAALLISAAFITKKNRVLGIIAGLLQIVSAYCFQKMVHIFMDIEMFKVIYGTQSEINSALTEYYMETFANMVPYMICGILFTAIWVVTLIFIMKSMKLTPKILPIFALISHIAHMCIGPIAIFQAFSAPLTEAVQRSTDTVNYIITLIPFVLIFVCALINGIRSKKAENAVEQEQA